MDSTNRMPTLSFTFLELLDRTFHVCRENFGAFVELSALVVIPATLIEGLFSLRWDGTSQRHVDMVYCA